MNKLIRGTLSILCLIALLSGVALAGDIPKNLQLYTTDTGVHLIWEAVPGATDYSIYLWDGNSNVKIGSVADNGTPAILYSILHGGPLAAGKSYVLSVKPSNSDNMASTAQFVYGTAVDTPPIPAPPTFDPTPIPSGSGKQRYPATLNQKMATRLGPNTRYSEALGTFPADTPITVIELEMGNGVPWALVDFWSNGGHYRAYTGMKRINTSASVPYRKKIDSTPGIVDYDSLVYYGPGEDYVPHKNALGAGQPVACFEAENGFYLIEWMSDGTLYRGYAPASAINK